MVGKLTALLSIQTDLSSILIYAFIYFQVHCFCWYEKPLIQLSFIPLIVEVIGD